MTMRARLGRILIGLMLLIGMLIALVALTGAMIPRWGATEQELTRGLPGDDLIQTPLVKWTNAITVDAPPEQVWPWIAQIGDSRGGYYSFTFIENQVGALMGDPTYNIVYRNAARVVPEWQTPAIGTPLIKGLLKLQGLQPGQWMLAFSEDPEFMLWSWTWFLEPVAGTGQTRLINRFAIDVPGQPANPVMGAMLNFGGFIMQNRMLQGIKLRAEGRTEPDWIEAVEVALWFAALLPGLLAAGLFVGWRRWERPLVVAITALIAIFVLTFVQPPLIWRVIIDVWLVVGVIWAWRGNLNAGYAVRSAPAQPSDRTVRLKGA